MNALENAIRYMARMDQNGEFDGAGPEILIPILESWRADLESIPEPDASDIRDMRTITRHIDALQSCLMMTG